MVFKFKRKEETAESLPLPSRIKTRPDYGLTHEEAGERYEAGLYNEAADSPSKTVGQIVADNIFTYFNLIFIVLAIALLAVGSYKNLTFMPVVVINTLIGLIQQLRAKKTLDRLTLMSEPKTVLVRQVELTEVLNQEAVLDDIAVFSTGKQICADAILLAGGLRVNESLVTGESEEVEKKPGDKLISGSFVVSGEGRARLVRVGLNSYVSKMTMEARKAKGHKPSGMMKDLTRLLQVIGITIIPMGFFMYTRQTALLGLGVKEGIENTTAALIGMIPEGLYLLVSVALAVSVVRLSRRRTLVRDLESIETLARVDVLCLDKTGTITENHMSLAEIIPLAGQETLPAVEDLLKDYSGQMPATNSTMAALKASFRGLPLRRADFVLEFSSSDKYSAVSFEGGENYAIGAPEVLLQAGFPQVEEKAQRQAAAGFRVLLLAACGDPKVNVLENIRPIALLLLKNPIRPNAKATFEYFENRGVELKVISGDNPATVAVAAKNAGIKNAENFVDARSLKNDEDLTAAAEKYTVFGRTSPEQKRKLILALKKKGKKVAMTGDGVNDVPALKAADCAIAMAQGSDVASKVSHLVMLDSDFDSMPEVVAEGRRVINNIERTASLFLVKNIFSFILALISISAVFAYPLTPAQLSLASTITIGIPSFFLALEANNSLVRGRFIVNVIYRALPAALTNLFIIIGVVLFDKAFDLPAQEVSTIAAVLISCVGLIMVWKVSTPLNWQRGLLLVSLVALFLVALTFFPALFSIVPLGLGSALVLGVFILLIPSLMWLTFTGMEKIEKLFKTLTKKTKTLRKN